MPLPNSYIDTLKSEVAKLNSMLEPLESGKMRLGERKGGTPWRDTTQAQIDHIRRTIKIYQGIIEKRDA